MMLDQIPKCINPVEINMVSVACSEHYRDAMLQSQILLQKIVLQFQAGKCQGAAEMLLMQRTHMIPVALHHVWEM